MQTPTISCGSSLVPWPGPLVANAPSPSSVLQASFPANLQLVLVLRPTGFFQRTLSDIAFKFNRDDFKMKVPVSTVSAEPSLSAFWAHSILSRNDLHSVWSEVTLPLCSGGRLSMSPPSLEPCTAPTSDSYMEGYGLG